jgi:hypothetical protein
MSLNSSRTSRREKNEERLAGQSAHSRAPQTLFDIGYKTWGVSILAALDPLNGRVTARVERRHRSREFVALDVV